MKPETITALCMMVGGLAALKAKHLPLRPVAIAAVPLGGLLLVLGDARMTVGTAAAWAAVAWLYNR